MQIARSLPPKPVTGGVFTPPVQPARARDPERTCVGCGTRGRQSELLRCVFGPDGEVAVDVRGVAGRGAWLHARPQCIERATRGGFARSLRRPISVSPTRIEELVHSSARKRLAGLLQGARSGRHLLFGRDMVRSVVEHRVVEHRVVEHRVVEHRVVEHRVVEHRAVEHRAVEHRVVAVSGALEAQVETGAQKDSKRTAVQLVILAEDAGSLAQEDFVRGLALAGKLVVWGTKEQHGQALGRGEVAILALTEIGLAAQVARTLALLRLPTLASGAVVAPEVQGQPESARLSED